MDDMANQYTGLRLNWLAAPLSHLVFDAGFVETVAADGASVRADVPRPHCHGVPLLDLEPRSHLEQSQPKFVMSPFHV